MQLENLVGQISLFFLVRLGVFWNFWFELQLIFIWDTNYFAYFVEDTNLVHRFESLLKTVLSLYNRWLKSFDRCSGVLSLREGHSHFTSHSDEVRLKLDFSTFTNSDREHGGYCFFSSRLCSIVINFSVKQIWINWCVTLYINSISLIYML